MKSIDEAEARARLDEVLDEAQRQPIMIRRRGEEIAILLSMSSIDRRNATWVKIIICAGTFETGDSPMPSHSGIFSPCITVSAASMSAGVSCSGKSVLMCSSNRSYLSMVLTSGGTSPIPQTGLCRPCR